MNEEALCTLALSLIPGLGPLRFQRLVALAGQPSRVFSLPREKLRQAGFPSAVIEGLAQEKKALRRAREECERLGDLGARALTIVEEAYPPLLREIADPPPVLFVRGSFPTEGHPLAVVGSRAATSYGRRVAQEWAFELARAGLDIVSGLAVGIDAAAHRGVLRAGGHTVAVLGCGLDRPYPQENRPLLQEILESRGAVVTEFPLGTEPKPHHFPLRNRLISGLSLGVLVVEASPRSGSLITARLAGEQGREVMAVPGSVYSHRSRGCHRLMREGALPVDSPSQVLEALGLEGPVPEGSVKELTLPPAEAKVLGHLEVYPIHVDDLAQKTGLEVSRLSGILLALELKGLAKGLAGNFYQKVNENEEGFDHR